MRELPVQEPGEPDHRSAARYLWWVARSQLRGMLAAALLGIVWMVAQALMPAVIGHAIDAGVSARDGAALALWTGLLFCLGVIQAAAVPVMAGARGLRVRPRHHRQQAQRERQAQLATRASDIVAGLRVLRGIGGEDLFAARYTTGSQAVMRAGIKVGAIESLLAGAEILLPGLLVALVVWIGATMALNGTIRPGQLVACYGYAVFLTGPIGTLTELADKITRGLVAAPPVTALLDLAPHIPRAGSAAPPAGAAYSPDCA